MKKLVFDVGASAIKYALMDDDANICERGKEITPQDTLQHFLEIIKTIYQKYQDKIDGIAFSIPGTIDSKTGQIYAPGGLMYNENINLANEIKAFTDLPVKLENDGKCAALAEVWKGNLKDCQDGAVIVVGSGLGGGIIKDGRLMKGRHLFAGEFSYVFQGTSGSFMDSAWTLKGSTIALIREVAANKQMDMSQLDGYKIFQMIESGDTIATQALENVAKNLAIGIYNLQCILDPEKILIGGGISQQPLLISKIQEELDVIYNSLPFEIPHAIVENCCFYNDSNLIGALYNFLF